MAEDQETRLAEREALMASSLRPVPILSQDAPPTWGALADSATEGGVEVQSSGRTRGVLPPKPPASPPPRGVWPSEMPPLGESNPTRIVNQWLAAYEIEGRGGLQDEFYSFAQTCLDSLELRKLDGWSKSNEERSWGLLLRDKEEGTNLVASLLSLLPDKIILALLRGELPLKWEEDQEVKRFVNDHMQLDDTPGIYVNLLHNLDYRWLSSQDLEALIGKLERYIEVEPSGLPRSDQIAVDMRHSNWTPRPDESKIRWLQSQSGARPESIIQEWIATIREVYCGDSIDATTASRRSSAEVGWASNTKARSKQYLNETSTNYLFELLNAICRTPRPSGFALPPPMQLVLFPIWERDEMLCRVGEIVGSMLCSSYWYLGGLNCSHAGTMNWDPEDGTKPDTALTPASRKSFVWGDNTKAVQQRLALIKPLNEEKLKAQRLDDARSMSEKSKEVEAELSALLDKIEDAREERKDLEAKVEAARARELDKAEAELDRMVAEMIEDEERWINDVLLKD